MEKQNHKLEMDLLQATAIKYPVSVFFVWFVSFRSSLNRCGEMTVLFKECGAWLEPGYAQCFRELG